MAILQIRRTEILDAEHESGRVRLFLGDGVDQDQSTQWILAQAIADTRGGNQLASVQLKSLQKLREQLDTEISRLGQLLN